MIGALKGEEPRIGMRVQAVFKEERQGNMLDILYFKPVEEEKGGGRRVQRARPKKKAGTKIRRKGEKGKIKVKAKRVLKKKAAKGSPPKMVKGAHPRGKRAMVPRRKTKGKK
jgi:hypothetical protein